MDELADLLNVARSATAMGSELLATIEPGEVSSKSDRDFVTELDVRIQETVRQYLAKVTPGKGFLGEEDSADMEETYSGSRWILDPIDGTSNFIHGIPLCAVSLALVRNNIPVVGVIGAPFLNLEYYAAQGFGAFNNGHRIKASDTRSLQNAIISIGDYAVGPEAATKNHHRLAVTRALSANAERVRMFGTAALDLAWVAEGRTDGCVLLSNKPWDTAAGVLIARESGALVTDSSGRVHSLTASHTIAAAPALSQHLVDLVSAAAPDSGHG